MYRSKKGSKGKVLNEDFIVEVKPLEPWPNPPSKKRPDSQFAQKLKGKSLNEDFIVKVKPLEPWPDPPPKEELDLQRSQKSSEGISGTEQNPKQPAKKD